MKEPHSEVDLRSDCTINIKTIIKETNKHLPHSKIVNKVNVSILIKKNI